MERWVIIGASGGIGGALCTALRARGAEAVGLSRRGDGLDVTDERAIRAVLDPLPSGAFDGVIVATGALVIDGVGPEKTLKRLDMTSMAAQFALNAAGPALVMKHALRLLPRDRRAVFAALSARVGSIGDNGLGGWYAYRAAKAALNQLIHTAAIEASRTHPQSICVTLHPGTVETGLGPDYRAGHPTVTPDAAAANLLSVIDGLTPAETGGFFDWAGKTIPW
ncbi:MAG: SDR family NAD(P)-dependent oxidoreductase [Paracoccaceae bacterium]|nr:SDR family NAD(P)-dependent oxidoreductase [Paracoccaceae bacterium]MDE3122913.1 SDR family NAD(P)-dependent oxidoreductase [Paracoccaceae bacterium]